MKNNNSQHPLRKNSGRRKRLPEEQAWESLSEHLKNSIIASARALSAELDAENHPGTIAIDANKRLVLLPFRETPEPGIEEHFDQVCTLDKPEKTGIKRNRRYIVDWHKLFFPCTEIYRRFHSRNIYTVRLCVYYLSVFYDIPRYTVSQCLVRKRLYRFKRRKSGKIHTVQLLPASKRRTVRAIDTAELYGTFRTTRYFSYRQVLPPIP